MSLLAEVVRLLEQERVPHALIGAGAMALRGFSRGTADSDLLILDASLLNRGRWDSLATGRTLEIFKGDLGESLAGTVRLKDGGETVDVVVGHDVWQRALIEDADRMTVGDITLPVVKPAALVLLKLHAGGSKDAWDIDALLRSSVDQGQLRTEVERTLPRLPEEARQLWARILSGAKLTE
jgi:predicted nucleotidyltransferase